MSSGSLTFDLSMKLRERLREVNAQKERTQAKINLSADQLQRLLGKIPRKPRENETQLDARIQELERQRTTSSLALSDEKAILRQIAGINRAKTQVVEYEEHEKLIQDKKAEVATFRDSLRTIIAQIAELESALSKVELAKRLGCTTAELQTRIVDCPGDKLGQVIGKNGANLKQLEEKTGVHVDVDKIGLKIHLHGSMSALNAAVAEVENITLAVEEDVPLSNMMVMFLVAKRLAGLNKLQEAHPMVYFDLPRNSSTIQLRGQPDHVALAKKHLGELEIKSLTRVLSGRETGLIVGKGGATINKMVETHDVVIDVRNAGDDTSIVEVVGLPDNAESAFTEIESILFENEEVEDFVYVNSIQRTKLLAETGTLMKELQSEVNEACEGGVLLLFEKLSKEEMRASVSSRLTIKAPRLIIQKAKEVVQTRLDAYEAEVLTIRIDPDIIPSVIGKGGATINSLRQEGSGAEIEVDKSSGEIRIMAKDDEAKGAIKLAIEKIVSENQVLTLDVEKNLLGVIFGAAGKEMRDKITEEMEVYMGIDPSDKFILFRGSEDKIKEAADIVREFISVNYTVEFEIPAEDEPLLFQGGPDSVLRKLESDHDVKATVVKGKHLMVIRGKEENVAIAQKEVIRFFEGGDGYAVSKVKVPEGVLGIVIGKSGSNLTKLESEFEGVSLQILRESNQLCIRGPEDKVDQCRSSVITTVATARVTETIAIDNFQHDGLARNETLKKLTVGIPAQITLNDKSVVIRGISSDVIDAKALVQEHLTGTYVSSVELDASQLGKVRTAIKDPSHFDRIRKATGTKVNLDSVSGTIVISGKRSNVKKAKTFIMGFLDFLLPAQFSKVKVAKPLIRSVGEPAALAKIAADTSSTVSLERDTNCILVQSSDPVNVQKAVNMINDRIQECEKLNYVLKLESSDAWLLPKLIGRGGGTIQKIQTDSGCNLDVFKDELLVAISGETEEAVNNAKDCVEKVIEQARRECTFIDIPELAMPAFIGKAGANIKQLAEDNDVQIERMRKDPCRIQIQGDEASVLAAAVAVNAWLKDWEAKNAGKVIAISEAAIPGLLGKEGSVVSSIQREFRVKIDIDRKKCLVIIRGGEDSDREQATSKINNVIAATMAEIVLQQQMKARKEAEEALARAAAKEAANNDKSKPETTTKQPPALSGERKDRTTEFAAVPVGLTVVGNLSEIPGKKPKNRNTKKGNDTQAPQSVRSNVIETSNFESKGAKNLFQMLVSEKPSVPPLSKSQTDEQWDSSTVSSAAASSSTDDESGGEEPVAASPYVKSISGVSIRL